MLLPRICKLRNGVNKTPQFRLCLTAKCGTKTIAQNEKKDLILVRNEYSLQPSKLLYNCQSQRMGGGWIFLKTFCVSLFNEDLSNEPNFGWVPFKFHTSAKFQAVNIIYETALPARTE